MDVVYCSWIFFPVNEMMCFLYLDSSNDIWLSCQKGGRHKAHTHATFIADFFMALAPLLKVKNSLCSMTHV